VWGFPTPAATDFRLCKRPLSLAVIWAALSPHPKIPFLADKVGGGNDTRFAVREPDFGASFSSVELLLGI
jgi:hypothetical protein